MSTATTDQMVHQIEVWLRSEGDYEGQCKLHKSTPEQVEKLGEYYYTFEDRFVNPDVNLRVWYLAACRSLLDKLVAV